MVQFASYVRRVLHKTRLIFSRINGPIIVTCGSNSLRRGAVRENLTLDALLKFARALELSEQQASQVEKATSDVSVIKTKTNERLGRQGQRNEHSSHPRERRSQSRNRQHLNKRNKKSGPCENCGGYAPQRNPCPARGNSCNACRKIGHFAHFFLSKSRAKSRTVAHVESGHLSGEEYEYVCTVNYIQNKKPPMCEVQINGKAVEKMIDTSVSVKLLDEKTYRRINSGNTPRSIPTDPKPLFLC